MSLDKILKNKSVMGFFEKQFSKVIESEGVKFIGIYIKENGEKDIQLYKDEMIVVKKEIQKDIIDEIKSLRQTEIGLIQKIKEDAETIAKLKLGGII